MLIAAIHFEHTEMAFPLVPAIALALLFLFDSLSVILRTVPPHPFNSRAPPVRLPILKFFFSFLDSRFSSLGRTPMLYVIFYIRCNSFCCPPSSIRLQNAPSLSAHVTRFYLRIANKRNLPCRTSTCTHSLSPVGKAHSWLAAADVLTVASLLTTILSNI